MPGSSSRWSVFQVRTLIKIVKAPRRRRRSRDRHLLRRGVGRLRHALSLQAGRIDDRDPEVPGPLQARVCRGRRAHAQPQRLKTLASNHGAGMRRIMHGHGFVPGNGSSCQSKIPPNVTLTKAKNENPALSAQVRCFAGSASLLCHPGTRCRDPRGGIAMCESRRAWRRAASGVAWIPGTSPGMTA